MRWHLEVPLDDGRAVGRRDQPQPLAIIDPLLRGERVTLHGQWLNVDDVVLLPPPARRIPIMIASKGERMLRLTARHGQAWNCAFGWANTSIPMWACWSPQNSAHWPR